jgi:hypothetical protein
MIWKRYILTRRVEKGVPLSRLTTIVMRHRAQKAALRSKVTPGKKSEELVLESKFKKLTTMELLGHGLTSPLHRKHGWLKHLLLVEGTNII